jgi:KDO2-lipid IV(A) lauroyltransferase
MQNDECRMQNEEHSSTPTGSKLFSCSAISGLRNQSAAFWLAIFFQMTAIAPALVLALRPVFIRLAFAFSPKIRRNTRLNALRLGVDPNRRRHFGVAVVGSFYDFVYDIGRSMGSTREQLMSRVAAIDGADAYLAIRARHCGAILLSAHMGSFEAGLAALPMQEKRVHVVFKRDQMPGFEKLRRSLREQLNVVEAPIDDGLAGWMRLRDALLNDEVVAVQGDRVMPGQKGVPMPVLGGNILLPSGPFKLALASGSPVIPIFSVRQSDGRVRIIICTPIDVSKEADGIEKAMQSFTKSLTAQLSEHPEQWLMLDAAFCEDA